MTNNAKAMILTIATVTIGLALLIGGGLFVMRHANTALPHLYVGEIAVGGKTNEEISQLLASKYNTLLDNGLSVASPDGLQTKKVDLQGVVDPDSHFPNIDFNAENIAWQAVSFGHQGNAWRRTTETLRAVFSKVEIDPAFSIRENNLMTAIRSAFPNYEAAGRPTNFAISFSNNDADISVAVEAGTKGTEFDQASVITELKNGLKSFNPEAIRLKLAPSPAPIDVNEATKLAPQVKSILEAAPLALEYKNGDAVQKWTINKQQLAGLLEPALVNGQFAVQISTEKFQPTLNTIMSDVNVPAINARFSINGQTVSEFVGSQAGVEVDEKATTEALNGVLGQKDGVASVAVKVTEPTIKTADVNNLGITEILGVGTSSWHGSPKNRILNIRHATEKLNGLLFAPGERISAIDKLKPLTLEDGYLPEMVILGDEIKPEVAGGLCQIGTTIFRGAMNSGLEINERRNHSLVVSYYNDPQNNNPGTDATLYEPHPDLQFTNNTGHYILLTTKFDEAKEQLVYTFWGTSDGRHGHYTPPKVSAWHPFGDPIYKETDTLAPGQIKCQAAHPGASTTFDYLVDYADGTQAKQAFPSEYRPLPKICLVGKDPNFSIDPKTGKPLETIAVPTEVVPEVPVQ